MEIKDLLNWLGLSVEELAGIVLLRYPEFIAKKRGKRKLFFQCLAELCVEAMVLGGKIGIDQDGNPISSRPAPIPLLAQSRPLRAKGTARTTRTDQ